MLEASGSLSQWVGLLMHTLAEVKGFVLGGASLFRSCEQQCNATMKEQAPAHTRRLLQRIDLNSTNQCESAGRWQAAGQILGKTGGRRAGAGFAP